MASLEERLEAGFAEAWRPKDNKDHPKTIIGEVVEISQRETDFGFYPIVTVKQDDGKEFAIHAMTSVIKNEILRLRPKISERIGIRYDGYVETPNGPYKGYEKYTVRMDRVAEFDWSKFGVEPDPEPAPPSQDPVTQTVTVPAGAVVQDDSIPFAAAIY